MGRKEEGKLFSQTVSQECIKTSLVLRYRSRVKRMIGKSSTENYQSVCFLIYACRLWWYLYNHRSSQKLQEARTGELILPPLKGILLWKPCPHSSYLFSSPVILCISNQALFLPPNTTYWLSCCPGKWMNEVCVCSCLCGRQYGSSGACCSIMTASSAWGGLVLVFAWQPDCSG